MVVLAVHSGLVAVAGMLAFLVGAAWIEYADVISRQNADTTAGE